MHEIGTIGELMERHRRGSGPSTDGGVSDRWVVIRLGRIPMPFLNTSARRRALALHDVNHLLAGYGTGNIGEAEISAWELASGGCGPYPAAWALDLAGMLLGMVRPLRVMKAFAAGRRMRNAYGCEIGEIMDVDLAALRRVLVRSSPSPLPTFVGSGVLFLAFLILALPLGAAFLVTVILSLPIWAFTKDTPVA